MIDSNKHNFGSTQFMEKFTYIWTAWMLLFVLFPFPFGLINLCPGFSRDMTGTEMLTFIMVTCKMEVSNSISVPVLNFHTVVHDRW
jgi:hypothetical protein